MAEVADLVRSRAVSRVAFKGAFDGCDDCSFCFEGDDYHSNVSSRMIWYHCYESAAGHVICLRLK